MIKKYLALGGYGQWGVPFDTEDEALRAIYENLKSTGKNDDNLPEEFDAETFDLDEADPLGYFMVSEWHLLEAIDIPAIHQQTELLVGFAIDGLEDDGTIYGFFEDYDDGVDYYEKNQKALDIPELEEDEIDPIEVVSRIKGE